MAVAIMLVGAYGRDANLADWGAGKDFQVLNGPYCSIRDLRTMKNDGFDTVMLLSVKGPCVSIDIDKEIAK